MKIKMFLQVVFFIGNDSYFLCQIQAPEFLLPRLRDVTMEIHELVTMMKRHELLQKHFLACDSRNLTTEEQIAGMRVVYLVL